MGLHAASFGEAAAQFKAEASLQTGWGIIAVGFRASGYDFPQARMNAKLNQFTSAADGGINLLDVVDGVVFIMLELVSSLLEAALGH